MVRNSIDFAKCNCTLIFLRLRDGKLEQGVLREAASRLQQKIQKHLLDSEDLKEQALDEEKSKKLLDEVDSKEELVPPMEMKKRSFLTDIFICFLSS